MSAVALSIFYLGALGFMVASGLVHCSFIEMQWLPWGDCIGKSVHFCQNLEYVNNINSVNKKSIKAKFWTYAKKRLSKKSVTWLLDLIYVCRFV
jgi:hypothetical protein